MKKKNKKPIGYATLKQACMVAREEALARNCSHWNPVCVYVEKDGTFTIGNEHTKNGKFVTAVDKSGARYRKVWERSPYSDRKWERFVRIKE